MNDAYIRTVQLLLDIAPAVFDTPEFAMKGGTALNLFVQAPMATPNCSTHGHPKCSRQDG